jgi:hypothetical protein
MRGLIRRSSATREIYDRRSSVAPKATRGCEPNARRLEETLAVPDNSLLDDDDLDAAAQFLSPEK